MALPFSEDDGVGVRNQLNLLMTSIDLQKYESAVFGRDFAKQCVSSWQLKIYSVNLQGQGFVDTVKKAI